MMPKANGLYSEPYQSVGAKAVVTLAAKLMLAMLPPQTDFLQATGKETIN